MASELYCGIVARYMVALSELKERITDEVLLKVVTKAREFQDMNDPEQMMDAVQGVIFDTVMDDEFLIETQALGLISSQLSLEEYRSFAKLQAKDGGLFFMEIMDRAQALDMD